MFPKLNANQKNASAERSGFNMDESEEEFDARMERERGPRDDDDDSIKVPPKYQKVLESYRRKHFAQEHHVGDNGVNYHYLFELTDEHLPDLAFTRYHNMFIARPANACLKTPMPLVPRRQLFGDLWREGELMLLFADTGLGKSALAVQIAAAVAGGEPISPFGVTTGPQRVLYFDFELSDEQFAARYSDPGTDDAEAEELFPVNFIRCSPRDDRAYLDENSDEYSTLIASIADTIRFTDARVIIVDNITWMSPSTENSTAAQRLMRTLVDLRNQLELSVLVIAHTPKIRHGIPLGLNHLQGSKMLSNFADNILAMGKSSISNELRYLKPLKQRNSGLRFGEASVPIFRLERNGRMLGFTFVDNEPENIHLKDRLSRFEQSEAYRRQLRKRAKELSNAGDTVRQIATKLNISVGSVSHYLNGRRNVSKPVRKDLENADFCSHLFTTDCSQCEQKSEFLKNLEASE